MQIEETIRDLKSHRFGFALRYARTKRAERLEALLLVAALASFIRKRTKEAVVLIGSTV